MLCYVMFEFSNDSNSHQVEVEHAPRFHDVHHAFPNAVGTLSQRGRFHGWEKVHDAAAEVLHRGLWKPNGDEETQMQKTQKKRSLMMKQNK